MIGAFHQPVAVIADLRTLTTLPPNELAAGLAEVIKHGAIADAEFLSWIESHISDLNACDISAMAHAVLRSCEIKSAVVAADEKEMGIRAHLNFGHTFGHAIEAGMGYGDWLHGEAVGCGMVIAAELSKELGYINSQEVGRLTQIISNLHLPISPPNWPVKKYLDLMSHDKKAELGTIKYVVLEKMGQANVQKVANTTVENVLKRFGAT
jgi:3-dehydroquinate synthase